MTAHMLGHNASNDSANRKEGRERMPCHSGGGQQNVVILAREYSHYSAQI